MTEQSPPHEADASGSPSDNDADETMRRGAEEVLDTNGGAVTSQPAHNASDQTSSDAEDDDDALPPMTEQLSQQLGGIRGLVESGIPVGVFVLANVFLSDILSIAFGVKLPEGDALRWAIGSSVGVAVLIAIMRAVRKEPVRHALNGLLGIGIGAYLAWKSGDQGDFYLPGIIQGSVYGLVLMGSVAVKHPLVGWFWSVIAGGGKAQWREDNALVKVFGWLTILWGVVFLVKNLFRAWLYMADLDTVLGLVTLFGGYPLTALLVLITLWTVRRARPGMTMAPLQSS